MHNYEKHLNNLGTMKQSKIIKIRCWVEKVGEDSLLCSIQCQCERITVRIPGILCVHVRGRCMKSFCV